MRRTLCRGGPLIAAVLAVVLLAGCAGGITGVSAVRTGAPEVAEGVVAKVIDGDTLEIDFGGRVEKVRLIGVNAPEISRPSLGVRAQRYGEEAAGYTARRLSGRTVYVTRDVSERDKYGRLLLYVWLRRPRNGSEAEAREVMFNAELVSEGYAHAMTVPPDVRYAGLFTRLEREAREAGRGLWAVRLER